MTGPQVLQAQVAVEAAAEHAEGPRWDDRDGTLLWVDQYRGVVRRARPSTTGALVEEPPVELGMAVGAIVPDRAGALYRLDGDRPRLMLDGATISNGLAWTPDGGTLFYIDTPTRTVRRFTVADDGLSDGEVVIRIPAEQGAPDGMCVDAEGCLWVALWGGGAVQRYDTGGRLLARVEVAAAQVSSCCFGGPDLATLYITTSAEGYDEAALRRDPDAGRIFAVRAA